MLHRVPLSAVCRQNHLITTLRCSSLRVPNLLLGSCRSSAPTPWGRKSSSSSSSRTGPSCSSIKNQDTVTNDANRTPNPPSPLSRRFWTCRHTWRRAGINTLRCLVGCTVGDFSALWILQTSFPALGMANIMGLSMASGIATSIILETILLRRGPDRLPWKLAARTAMGMSLVSMLAMEAAENVVDYHLTGGVVALDDPKFWMAAMVSVGAGFLAPLPYNYWRLKVYGRACH